jgi:hypothetical protein
MNNTDDYFGLALGVTVPVFFFFFIASFLACCRWCQGRRTKVEAVTPS